MHSEYFKPTRVGTPNEPLTTEWCICCHSISQLTAEASGFAPLESGKGSYAMASQHHTSPWGMQHRAVSPAHQLEEELPLCSEKSGEGLGKKTLHHKSSITQNFKINPKGHPPPYPTRAPHMITGDAP